MLIKDRLRELRTAAGLSQQDVAVKAGLSVSNVAQIESGKIPNPRMYTLRGLARALGVTLDQLAGDDGERPTPSRRKGR
jgi:transcriptional regulator with XRE-family HTH domain